MSIFSVFQSQEAAEAKARQKQEAIEAKRRDVIRAATVAECNGDKVTDEDAKSVLDFCGTVQNHEANVESYESLAQFTALGVEVDRMNDLVDKSGISIADLGRQLVTATADTLAANKAEREAWELGAREVSLARAAATAEGKEKGIQRELTFFSSLLSEQQGRREALIDKQSAIKEVWIDPTSQLAPPLHFALHTGPRERPQTARTAAVIKDQESAARRRKTLQAEVETKISRLEAVIQKVNPRIAKAEEAVDSAAKASGGDSAACHTAIGSLQTIKSERSHARQRIETLQAELKELTFNR